MPSPKNTPRNCIASRRYYLARPRERRRWVTVHLLKPQKERAPPTTWQCTIHIKVGGDLRVRPIFGADSLQALELALSLIPAMLLALGAQFRAAVFDEYGEGVRLRE